jgi:hypothetical protein
VILGAGPSPADFSRVRPGSLFTAARAVIKVCQITSNATFGTRLPPVDMQPLATST